MKFVFFTIIFSITFGLIATELNDFDAVLQGQKLAEELCEQRPDKNLTNTGMLNIRDANGETVKVPITCEVVLTTTNWQSIYNAFVTEATKPSMMETLVITHSENSPNLLLFEKDSKVIQTENDSKNFAVTPFAGSDFLLDDLSLNFFHWPEQKILKHEMRRSRECKVLESINPNPSTNGYSRVVSWIDDETLGIVHAEAYDAKGKLLKVFDPKSFKKVNGQWQLQDMEIRNVQTGSRTRIEFNLGKK